jgi:glutamate decarboxylase
VRADVLDRLLVQLELQSSRPPYTCTDVQLSVSKKCLSIKADLIVINLGFEGYRRVMQNDLSKARLLSRALVNSGYYTVLSQIHIPKPEGSLQAVAHAAQHTAQYLANQGRFAEDDAEFYEEGLPVVAFMFNDKVKKQYPHVKQAWIQQQLRGIGWIVPK